MQRARPSRCREHGKERRRFARGEMCRVRRGHGCAVLAVKCGRAVRARPSSWALCGRRGPSSRRRRAPWGLGNSRVETSQRKPAGSPRWIAGFLRSSRAWRLRPTHTRKWFPHASRRLSSFAAVAATAYGKRFSPRRRSTRRERTPRRGQETRPAGSMDRSAVSLPGIPASFVPNEGDRSIFTSWTVPPGTASALRHTHGSPRFGGGWRRPATRFPCSDSTFAGSPMLAEVG